MLDVFDDSPGRQRLRLLEASYGFVISVNIADGLTLSAGALLDVKFAKQQTDWALVRKVRVRRFPSGQLVG